MVLTAVVALALPAGCADDEDPSVAPAATAADDVAASPSPSSPSGAAFPVSITHALGTTTVPEKPERIVALSFEQDLLGAIGRTTVGHAENFDTPGELYPWQEGTVSLDGSEVVTSLPAGEPELEEIAALDPDLILATNLYELPEFYDELSRIAPTVGYETAWGAASWQENAEMIGAAVGETDAVADVVDDLEDFISDLAEEFPGLEGKHYAGAYNHASSQFAVNANPNGHSARLFAQLGLTFDPELADGVENNALSMERLGLLDSDLLVVSYATPTLKGELESNDLFANLDVVEDGRYYAQDNAEAFASNNPTVLNIRWLLERRRDLFAAVAGDGATTAPTSASTP